MVTIESKQSPSNPKNQSKQLTSPSTRKKDCSIFSPRLKSAAALAGWDEEALLIASLVVEDTPDREIKSKKRSDLNFKTPPSSSRRKRRNQKRSPISIPVTVLDLDDEESVKQESEKKKTEPDFVSEEKKIGEGEKSSVNSTLPSMDKLREELSCAICLEICFEPSTTPCGHSFCKKCLRSAADKCGKKCPKCRQLISNGRSCNINTILWNTIQLLFPQEIEARKQTTTSKDKDPDRPTPLTSSRNEIGRRRRLIRSSNEDPAMVESNGRRREIIVPSQDEDAALALRLQREEFMEVFRDQPRNNVSLARENLRAMASRAMDIRIRGRTR